MPKVTSWPARAAFAAVHAGFQVAVVVPTTLLSRQHTRNFMARFNGMPVHVAQLSRMVTAKESKETKLLLADIPVTGVL